MKLGELIEKAYPDLREIVFHSDGRIIAKTGGKAKFPKKLYAGRGNSFQAKIYNAVEKLIKENT